jgi:asparagine synthase (glutamine-hydrolysing)
MCGISGVFDETSTSSTNECWKMVESGRHRGPDGSHLSYSTDNQFSLNLNVNKSTSWCVLGHSRLTILDLSDASNQPFLSSDKRYALVFNGEIYNYIELREELQDLGIQFHTSGDTEVLLNALIAWGVAAICKLRGMFAFAFADAQEKTLLLARDRYGIKPLHLYQHDGRYYFASEIKQFTDLEDWNPKVNEEVALQFLLYGITDHRKETLFQDIERILPGHYLLLSKKSVTKLNQIKWYGREKIEPIGSYSEAKTTFRNEFEESIRVHLRSDVPIGFCLSGGLDSSAIVGVAADLLDNSAIHTFTATSEQKKIDETKYVNEVVDLNDCIPHFVQPTSQRLLSELDLLTWHQDEPFGGTSIFAQWCVFELIQKSGVKVVLDGQGADEQLAGYNSFLLTYLSSLLKKGRLIKFLGQYKSINSAGRINFVDLLQFMVYQIFPPRMVSALGKILGIASQNGGDWVNSKVIDRNNIEDPFKMRGRVPRNISQLSEHMITVTNLPMLLRFEDRNSMAHSVESRVPFVDRSIFETVERFSDSYLIDGDYTKRVLRDALSDYLPELVKDRRDKIGFQTAEEIWMKNESEGFKKLVKAAIQDCPVFFTKETELLCTRIIDSEVSFSPVPWRVISFGAWARVFHVKGC